MARPSGTAQARPEIAASLLEFDYAMNQGGFVSTSVFPIFPVNHHAGTFGRVSIEELLKPQANLKRAPGSGYNRDTMTFGTDTWLTEEYGHEEVVDDREAAQWGDYFDHEVIAAQRASNVIMENAETRVAGKVFDTAVFTGAAFTEAVAAGDKWSAASTADPSAKVAAWKKKVFDNCGMWPDSIVMNRATFNALREVTLFRARIHSSGAGTPDRAARITVQQVAEVFDLPYVYVAGGAYNSAAPNATAVPAHIWGNNVMVFKGARTSDLREPCLGRTFHWSGDGSVADGRVESYTEDRVRGTIIRVRHQTHEKLLYKECGFLATAIL
jgi:hypothetical protein